MPRMCSRPDDLFAGAAPASPVVVFDDDCHYMGGSITEKLANDGLAVILVTPSPMVSAWAEEALEQHGIQTNLVKIGVRIVTGHSLTRIDAGGVQVEGGLRRGRADHRVRLRRDGDVEASERCPLLRPQGPARAPRGCRHPFG